MVAQVTRTRSRSSRRRFRKAANRVPTTASPPTVPEDAALYVCGCGNAFTAAVTTSVTCPACGDGQAW
jgi:hypothetical protein